MNVIPSLQISASKIQSQSISNPSFVLISSDLNCVGKIKEEIERISSVSKVTEVEGMYDLVVKMESESSNEIRETIGNKIRNIEGVRTCLSLLGVEDDNPMWRRDVHKK